MPPGARQSAQAGNAIRYRYRGRPRLGSWCRLFKLLARRVACPRLLPLISSSQFLYSWLRRRCRPCLTVCCQKIAADPIIPTGMS